MVILGPCSTVLHDKNALKARSLHCQENFKNVYLEDLLINLVPVVGTAGLAGGAGIKTGEAPTSAEDPDGMPDVFDGSSGMAEGGSVFVVSDLKKKDSYYY